MVDFIVYDLVLLAIFAIFVSFFLYKNKANLKKEGLLFLYKASWGIKLINYVGNKYKKTLNFFSWISITVGYILMGIMIYFLGRIIWIYVFFPEVVRAIKIPPILPLVPYLPQAFKLDFLPPFFFTYWIVILAIIAISHEFAHGIFAAYNKIKIKSTGFGFFPFFLPVFLAAFVELDEEKMAKHKKKEQLAILSAGTFANVLVAILFGIIFWLFFSLAFVPGGVQYDSYAYEIIPIAGISMVNNISFDNPDAEKILDALNGSSIGEVEAGEDSYYGVAGFSPEGELVQVYHDAPAIKNRLGGVITEINGVDILSRDDLGGELSKYTIGDEITITAIDQEREVDYNIVLEAFPDDSERAWLGILFSSPSSGTGILGRLSDWFTSFKEPHVYYEPKWDGLSVFIYNLLWWLILISISVALINMLPVGIFDGGRFFYLTVLGITGSPKIARRAFAFTTYLFLFLVLLLMFFWAISFL